MNILPYELLRSIELARPTIVEWILPGLFAVLGISFGVRGIIALRRMRHGRCPCCGYSIQGASGAPPERCSECGLAVARDASARRRRIVVAVLMIAFGSVMAFVVLRRAFRYDATAPVALLLTTSGLGIVVLVLTIGRHRTGRRTRLAAIVAIALLLQTPWIFVTWRLARVAYAQSIVDEWRSLGMEAGVSSLPNALPDPWLAWIPARWQGALSTTWVALGPPTIATWPTIALGPTERVVMIWTGMPDIPSPTADAIRALARFPELREFYIPRLLNSPDRLQALRDLPPRLMIGGNVYDADGKLVGHLIDLGDDVRLERTNEAMVPRSDLGADP